MKVTNSLWEIGGEYLELMDLLEENEGEMDEEMEVRLEINMEEFDQKSENYIKMIKKFEDDQAAIKRESDRLKDLMAKKKKGVESLKKALHVGLELRGGEKMEIGTHSLSFRKSSSVVVNESFKLDEEWCTVKTTYSPDKKAIKEAIGRGELIEGAHIANSKNLQIK